MLWLLHLEMTLPAEQAGETAWAVVEEDPPLSGGAGTDKQAGKMLEKELICAKFIKKKLRDAVFTSLFKPLNL